MRIIDVKKADVTQNPHGVDARRIYDTDDAQVVHISLKPGEALKRHSTPVNVIFYVLEGKGIVEIGNEKKEVDKDTLIESPAKIPHCWYNESEEIVRFLVVKVPKPKESAKLL
ncbi:cupin domain-containing protein [candidate division WOR-3 bacterium]|nr:cupin domain-containing protein [candidate division WOR-3 bacterium]MCK4575001.1 cupin domain-containing protein [candidate division WOR-3 bacterium]